MSYIGNSASDIWAKSITNDSGSEVSPEQKQTSIWSSYSSGLKQIDTKKMKALLYGLDRTIREFEVSGIPPHFILVEVEQKGTFNEKLFRLINDPCGSSSIGYYAEYGVKPDYFRMRASDARVRYNYDYAIEMDYMAERVARPEFSAPVVGKIERYNAWVTKPNFMPNSTSRWSKPIKNLVQPDPYAVINPNLTYTPKEIELPALKEPDIIGEPRPRLLLIVKDSLTKDLTTGKELE